MGEQHGKSPSETADKVDAAQECVTMEGMYV